MTAAGAAFAPLSEPLEGRIVTVCPLAPEHEPGLREASRDPRAWRLMSWNAAASDEAFSRWIAEALEARREGREDPFCVLDARSGRPLGSTRYLTLRPEHRGLEIGWTWLEPAAWGTGANAEAKLLLLERAFETLGCMRVEFKTDARNERARAALAALPATFEGVHRKHMLVRDGELRDSAWYSVVDDDWPAVRRALGARVAARAEA